MKEGVLGVVYAGCDFFSSAAIDDQLEPDFCFDDVQVVPQHW